MPPGLISLLGIVVLQVNKDLNLESIYVGQEKIYPYLIIRLPVPPNSKNAVLLERF